MNDSQANYFIGVSHIAPFDGDFARNKEEAYRNLLASADNFLISLHGHQHKFSDSIYYQDGVRYLIAHPFEGREYVILSVKNKETTKSITQH